jgi:hypothetical protein
VQRKLWDRQSKATPIPKFRETEKSNSSKTSTVSRRRRPIFPSISRFFLVAVSDPGTREEKVLFKASHPALGLGGSFVVGGIQGNSAI